MSRPIPSHRVEIVEEDSEPRSERSSFRDKSPPRSDREREYRGDRDYRDRSYSDYHSHPHDYYRHFPPYMYQPYYGPPVVYQPPQQGQPHFNHNGQPQHWDPQAHGFVQAHNPNNPQAGTNASATPQNHSHFPAMQPQFLAVNVKTDTHQSQTQDQKQKAENKQLTVKEKVVHNVSKGLESLLDVKVLAVGIGTLFLQHLVRNAQENARKGKKKGVCLSLGLL